MRGVFASEAGLPLGASQMPHIVTDRELRQYALAAVAMQRASERLSDAVNRMAQTVTAGCMRACADFDAIAVALPLARESFVREARRVCGSRGKRFEIRLAEVDTAGEQLEDAGRLATAGPSSDALEGWASDVSSFSLLSLSDAAPTSSAMVHTQGPFFSFAPTAALLSSSTLMRTELDASQCVTEGIGARLFVPGASMNNPVAVTIKANDGSGLLDIHPDDVRVEVSPEAGSPGAAAAVDSPAGTAIVSPVTVTGATVSFTYTVADSTVPSLSLAVFVYGVAVCVAQVHKGYAGGRTHIATHTCPASSSFCVGGKGDWLALLSPSPVNKLSLYSLPSFKDLPSSLRASATTGTTAVAICAGRESDGNLLVVSRQGRGMDDLILDVSVDDVIVSRTIPCAGISKGSCIATDGARIAVGMSPSTTQTNCIALFDYDTGAPLATVGRERPTYDHIDTFWSGPKYLSFALDGKSLVIGSGTTSQAGLFFLSLSPHSFLEKQGVARYRPSETAIELPNGDLLATNPSSNSLLLLGPGGRPLKSLWGESESPTAPSESKICFKSPRYIQTARERLYVLHNSGTSIEVFE